MPKKGKKKGKKGGKKRGKKANKDGEIKTMSEANSKIWQTRLEVVEQSRVEHREHAKQLAYQNEVLHSQVMQNEQDTIDILTFMKNENEEKDKQIAKLKSEMQELQRQHLKEKEKLVEEFQGHVGELDSQLAQRTREVDIIRTELKMVKEFRRKRAQMQKELEEIKAALFEANEQHKSAMAKLEQKSFEEKMKLQQEANRKIMELADKAQTEAIANLDETTKSVFKENVRMTQALSFHVEEAEELRKRVSKLQAENEQLRGDHELNEVLVQQKVSQSQKNKLVIKELREKVATLEKSLGHVVHEFEVEQNALVTKTNNETESSRNEIARLQRVIELKTKEMNKVKKLARNILEQRTETEKFFLEALNDVKKEIAAHRLQYRRDAEAAYQRKLLDACMGKTEFPKVRTFNKTDTSTNSVYDDLQTAATGDILAGGRVDISELTWEQKEKVLRYLFARMNRVVSAPPSLPSKPAAEQPAPALTEHLELPSIMDKQAWVDNEPEWTTNGAFLTQAPVQETVGHLPSVHIPS